MGVWQILPFWLAFTIRLRFVWVYVAAHVWCLNCQGLFSHQGVLLCVLRCAMPFGRREKIPFFLVGCIGIGQCNSHNAASLRAFCIFITGKAHQETSTLKTQSCFTLKKFWICSLNILNMSAFIAYLFLCSVNNLSAQRTKRQVAQSNCCDV